MGMGSARNAVMVRMEGIMVADGCLFKSRDFLFCVSLGDEEAGWRNVLVYEGNL